MRDGFQFRGVIAGRRLKGDATGGQDFGFTLSAVSPKNAIGY